MVLSRDLAEISSMIAMDALTLFCIFLLGQNGKCCNL